MKITAQNIFKLFLLAILSSTLLIGLHSTRSLAQSPQDSCYANFSEADQLYLEGDRTAAEQLYRQCKQPFAQQNLTTFFPEPITDPERLSPAGKVYWREAQEGLERDQESRVSVALNELIGQHPDFVPAYSILAEFLQRYDRETEALETLEQAATLFPYNADIARARAVALRNAGQPLEASMAARLFAMVNPNHPERRDFIAMADGDLDMFRAEIQRQYITTGALGIVGNIFFGGGSTVSNVLDSAAFASMLFEGEDATGTRLAAAEIESAQANNALIDDPVILEYVDTIGQDIAAQMGRDEFNYEFNVLADNSLNAFALPGGKVFINTGAILAANSEAELAGLIGHEVAHAVLSHGYQRLATTGLASVLSEALPLGNFLGLATTGLSRDNEQQADIIGTRAIAGFGYAADGLRNLFVTLNNLSGSRQPEYLSSHPAPPIRVRYLEALIQQNGYNRYAYEGVEQHARIQQRIRELLS
jgi:predicted Zn-dependent protease